MVVYWVNIIVVTSPSLLYIGASACALEEGLGKLREQCD